MEWASVPVSLALAVRALAPTGPDTEHPVYPVSLAEINCVGAPCGGVQVADLELGGVVHGDDDLSGLLRVRIAERAVVGVWFDDAETGVRVSSTRFDVSAARGDGGASRAAAGVRLARFTVRLAAESRPDWLGSGHVASASVVASPTVDLHVTAAGTVELDTGDTQRFGPQVQRDGALEVAWQPGTEFEARATYSAGRLRGVDDSVSDSKSSSLSVGWTHDWLNVDALVGHDFRSGRTGHNHRIGRLRVDTRLGDRTAVHGIAWNRWEPGLKKIERDIEVGWTLYARRFSFARDSASAARTRDLVERARALGYHEVLPVSDEGRRDLRERLSLSRERGGLEGTIDALYRAQVSERNVVRLALSYRRSTNSLDGTTRESIAGTVGVPWPLSSTAGVNDEEVVDFLSADLRYESASWGGFTSSGHLIELRASVNRDAALRVAWDRRPRTPLQAALGEAPESALRIWLDYRFER